MNRRGILKHWILPEQGLNAAGTKYAYRPTGNRPEYMPWDTSLKKYLIDAVMYNVALTSYLKKDENGKMDPRKFDISTPTHLARCYTRLLEAGFPSSVNIATDVQKVIVSMKTVLKARGELVPGCGDRSGRRRLLMYENWGGKGVKGSGKFKALKSTHPDAKSAHLEFVASLANKTKGGAEIISNNKRKVDCDDCVNCEDDELVVFVDRNAPHI